MTLLCIQKTHKHRNIDFNLNPEDDLSPLPRSALVSAYGHTTVTLSSANSYSYDKVKMTFQQYTDQHTGPQSVHTLGNGKLSFGD